MPHRPSEIPLKSPTERLSLHNIPPRNSSRQEAPGSLISPYSSGRVPFPRSNGAQRPQEPRPFSTTEGDRPTAVVPPRAAGPNRRGDETWAWRGEKSRKRRAALRAQAHKRRPAGFVGPRARATGEWSEERRCATFFSPPPTTAGHRSPRLPTYPCN